MKCRKEGKRRKLIMTPKRTVSGSLEVWPQTQTKKHLDCFLEMCGTLSLPLHASCHHCIPHLCFPGTPQDLLSSKLSQSPSLPFCCQSPLLPDGNPHVLHIPGPHSPYSHHCHFLHSVPGTEMPSLPSFLHPAVWMPSAHTGHATTEHFLICCSFLFLIVTHILGCYPHVNEEGVLHSVVPVAVSQLRLVKQWSKAVEKIKYFICILAFVSFKTHVYV